MPQLHFPIAPGGLIVDVRVNLDSLSMGATLAAGEAPASVPGKAIIDTGSDVTAVSQAALRALGV